MKKLQKIIKRVQALGGAKNHLVVMPDANIDQAVDGIIGLLMVQQVKDVWLYQWQLPLVKLQMN